MVVAMAIQPGRTHGIDVGALLDAALREQGMSHKEAAILCGFRDGAQWSRAVHGEAHAPLDLWKFAELPWRIQATFWSKYIAAQASRFSAEMRSERVQMLKADLFGSSRKEA